jgi:hypothetical protein
MGNIGTQDQETLIALGKASFDGTALAQIRGDNLAKRIAAVLEERGRIGEERRRREREYLLRQAERGQLGVRRRREPKGSNRLVEEVDALCVAVISCNAANEAMKEYGILDAAASGRRIENGGARSTSRNLHRHFLARTEAYGLRSEVAAGGLPRR